MANEFIPSDQRSPLELIPGEITPPLDFSSLFGNENPVELEIGSGKGMFLKESALLNPGVNYLGVEMAGKFYRLALERLTRARRGNVRIVHANGLDVLSRLVPPDSLQALHIYFPDPWPKKRHHKRRLFTTDMLVLAARALVAEGEFRIATDHPDYGVLIRDLFEANSALFAQKAWPGGSSDQLPTNYSLKWKRAGRNLWWARYKNITV